MQMGAIRQQQRPFSQIDCLMQLKSGLNTWSQNDFNQGTCYTPVTQGTLGKSIFPAPLHPEKTAQSLFWRGFFPDSDVAFKSLDVCTQQINSWSSGRTKWFYGLKFETHWIQASALPLSELALSSTHRAALFFVGEGGRTALHINWQPTAVDLFPALYSFQDSKQGGWKASKCQSRLG